MSQLNARQGPPFLQHLLPRSLIAMTLALAVSAGAQATDNAAAVDRPGVRPAAEAPAGPLTRAEVRQALTDARNAGLLPVVAEIGDTPEMEARREAFYALQTEVMQAARDRSAKERAARGSAAVASELQAYVELRAAGAHPAMLRPSSDGTRFIDAEGRETLVVEIDD